MYINLNKKCCSIALVLCCSLSASKMGMSSMMGRSLAGVLFIPFPENHFELFLQMSLDSVKLVLKPKCPLHGWSSGA